MTQKIYAFLLPIDFGRLDNWFMYGDYPRTGLIASNAFSDEEIARITKENVWEPAGYIRKVVDRWDIPENPEGVYKVVGDATQDYVNQ